MSHTKWDERFLSLAKEVSTWSKDPSTKVGAVITQGKHVVSLGFNGYPPGIEDKHLDNRDYKYKRVIHAETNAILNAKQDLSDCTLYLYPLMPCAECAKLIVAAGIKKVYINMKAPEETLARYREGWYDSSMVMLEAGVEVYEVS